jgi:uncharacterized Zn-finger protein
MLLISKHMNNFEICYTDTKSVSCEGRAHDYDHPKVFLEIDPKLKEVTCPYCSKKFVLEQL